MLFPNWSGWKTLKLVLTCIGIAAGSLAASTALPALVVSIAQAVGAIDGAFLVAVIALSGTAAGPSLVKSVARDAVAKSTATLLVILGLGAGASGALIAGGASVEACTPAQSAMWSTVEQAISANYGAVLSVIEAAVIAVDPGAAAVVGLVDQLIVDGIQLLMDSGAWQDDAGAGVAWAKDIQAQAAAQAIAARAAAK